MIDVSTALKLIKENCKSECKLNLSLMEACGSILAEPVFATMDTPPFDQSAMDGYAFAFNEHYKNTELLVTEEIQAGAYSTAAILGAQAVRIYTGAALPPGADTVVMQEKITREKNSITITDEQLKLGSNVRKKGSQCKKGDLMLEAGQLLTPAGVSLLASNGIAHAKIYANPAVNLIVTGKELVSIGNVIKEGEIYESNSFGLTAALKQLGIAPEHCSVVDDNEEEILTVIKKNLNTDILILTGGVSVGDYDFVVPALERAGVKKVFHKVKQKPGKPFYFGVYDQTLVFALPGNPAAVLTCFYQYIVPAIGQFTHKKIYKTLQMPLANAYKKKAGLTHLLKGRCQDGAVTILDHQESYLVSSFAVADCIVELAEEQEIFEQGQFVTIKSIV